MGAEPWIIGFLVVGFLVVIGIGLELSLRYLFGLGDPLLYIADERIGYLLAPNQDVRRLGNRILINHYSMRTGAIAPSPPPATLRLLLIGDSIANGGWWTGQDETISAILQGELLQSLHPPSQYTAVEVLNASANSWGPRNELAYLEKYGCFGAQIVIVLINTDDLFATAPTSAPVGRDPHYPATKPPLALVEVFERYMLRSPLSSELQQVRAEGGDRVGKNLEAIRQIQELVTQAGGVVYLAMTPLLRELAPPGPRDYERQARDRLKAFTQTQNLPFLDFLPLFETFERSKMLYRDHIHLNAMGNRFVAKMLITQLDTTDFVNCTAKRINA